jgi:hypothetical protein
LRVTVLGQARDAFERFEHAEGWRREDLTRLHDRLDDHWANALTACVQTDDPLAFGIDKLRHARATTAKRLEQFNASIPADRAKEWQQARRQLPGLLTARHHAEQSAANSQEGLYEAARRRWGRRDHDAIAAARVRLTHAEDRLDRAVTAERDLWDQLATIAAYQQERQQALNDSRPRHHQLESALTQLDAGLDHTRPQRVHALADQAPSHHVDRLGEPPHSPAGRAVWCHHALPIEAVLDRNDGFSPPWTGWNPQTDRARKEITVADWHLESKADGINPSEWAELAEQASTIRDDMIKDLRVRQAHQQTIQPHQVEHHLHIDHSARPAGPQLSL